LWVDVESFEEAAAMARRTHNSAACKAAVGAYTGDLLPEDRYEEWVEDRRQELRTTYLVLLLELARHHEEREEFKPAMDALRVVLKSEPAHKEAHAGLMRLYALSEQRQAAVRQFERLQETLQLNLGTEPDATDRYLYEGLVAGRFPFTRPSKKGISTEEPPSDRRHNLPAARTSFIGRERVLVEVTRALETARLLTLTGTCGSGKTRLALEIASVLTDAYSDGVWITELAALSEEEQVLKAVAALLGLREQPSRLLVDTLVLSLRNKQMLLVLDSCEHLVAAVARLVDTLLNSCPRLLVLTTSREALGVAGEAKWLVAPLLLPDSREAPTFDNMAGYESVRLFVERAKYHHPDFVLTPRNVETVAGICRQLDGIPLAIELAAAWAGVLSVGQIAARLGDPLKLLTTGSRTAPLRQQTMRGALGWSYNLLSTSERRLFHRIAVFVGGCTLEAAEAVATGNGINEDDVLHLLYGLVNKSLVVAKSNDDGPLRYRMLELVRRYGVERLEESGESDTVRQQHSTYFLALAEEADPQLRGAQQEVWLDRLEREHNNLRAALSWMLARDETGLALRLAKALGEFWHMRGHLDEGLQWLEACLTKGDTAETTTRAKALASAGYMACSQGDYERSIALNERSLALSRKLADTVGAAVALSNLGWTSLLQNQCEQASKLAQKALTLQRTVGDASGVSRSLPVLALVMVAQRDYERALALHEENLRLARKVEDSFAIILSLMVGALAFLGLGVHGRVRDLYAEALELSRQLNMRQLTATHLHVAAALAGSRGQPVRSARLWGAAEALREAIDTIFSPFEHRLYEAYIAAMHARLAKTTREAAWAEGRAMTYEEAVEYALSEELRVSTCIPTPEERTAEIPATLLTRREWEVAIHVGRGLTNRQISAQLVLSEHTVAKHVRKILKKLGFQSRAQIANRVVAWPLPPSDLA